MGKKEIDLKSIFNSPIKKKKEGFESRKEQVEMSILVERSLQNSEFHIIEAGTGVGKSLAYLIPACLFSLSSGKKVVISTETKALQAQLLEKDIPMACEILGTDEIRAEIAFGAGNYLCKRKFFQTTSSGNIDNEMITQLTEFYEWEKQTESGLRREFRGFLTNDFWSKVSRDPEACLGRKCPNYSSSYYFLEKEKWKNANILIINHSLLAAHIAGNLKILPEFTHLIIDEAHNFPDTIGKSSRISISYSEIQKLFLFIKGNDRKNTGFLGKIDPTLKSKQLIEKLKTSEDLYTGFFTKLSQKFPLLFQSKRIKESINPDNSELKDYLTYLSKEFEGLKKKFDPESEDLLTKEILLDLDFATNKLTSLAEALSLAAQEKEEYVKWLEPIQDNNKEPFYSISIQPLDSAEILNEKLYPHMDSLVFTSATLSSGKEDFSYFKNLLGNPSTVDHSFASPFPYEKNSLLYLPKNIHDPVSEPKDFQEDLYKLIPFLLNLSGGSSFVLFTSNKMLSEVYTELEDKLDYPLFSQLELGAERAKEEFLANENSVLFGVSSFWQGIDIKGDKLKSVIITKLPFQPPGEPVLEAKIENLKNKNGNPFEEIQLPFAGITLKQGFGRLIRSKTDRGFVAIVDPRIQKKSYGRKLLGSLPPAKLVKSFSELKKNYETLMNTTGLET